MAEAEQIKEVVAYARAVHVPPRKARLVAATLKNLPVEEALTQLRFLTKKAAQPISKLVNSAIANAAHNFQIEKEQLFVKSLTVDGGPVYKRFTPRAQGRAFPVRKRTSHLNLILGVTASPIKPKKKLVTPEQPVHAEVKEVIKGEAKPERKESRFKFWKRKKKVEDTTQVPPKQEVRGKHYTGFDRRGNM